MKEIPILFSTPMVQAIMDGRKTITRRVMKPQPDEDGPFYMANAPSLDWEQHYNEVWKPWQWDTNNGERIAKFCPYGKPGDILWVRETWCDYNDGYSEENKHLRSPEPWILYKADCKEFLTAKIWRPSIFMPKTICRVWLQVTKVRAERLHNITEEDAKAEGVRYPVNTNTGVNGMVSPMFKAIENGAIEFMPKDWQTLPDAEKSKALLFAHWAELWCEINGRESWDANPWVWVIEFKILSTTGKQNIQS